MSIHQRRAENVDRVSYARLVWEAIPEVYIFQLLSWLLLSGLSWAMNQLISAVAGYPFFRIIYTVWKRGSRRSGRGSRG